MKNIHDDAVEIYNEEHCREDYEWIKKIERIMLFSFIGLLICIFIGLYAFGYIFLKAIQ